MADWMLPDSRSQSLFSSISGENIGSTAISEPACEGGENGFSFHDHAYNTNLNYRNESQDQTDVDQTDRSWAMSEQQMSSNGGFLERMGSGAGFNAPLLNTEAIRNEDLSHNWEVLSPYLTIPSGLSPTTLLESPHFPSNSMYSKNYNMDGLSESCVYKNNDNFFGNMDASSFAFRPSPQSAPNHFFASSDIASFPCIKLSAESGNTFPCEYPEHSKEITMNPQPDIDEQHQDNETDQSGDEAEDGYNWRKYGQKQAKGSDCLLGYYKCTYSHCLVKKKVEMSQEGHITEIIYKGSHNHPKPSNSHRSSSLGEHGYPGPDSDPVWMNLPSEYSNIGGNNTSLHVQNSSHFESGNVVDRSSAFSNDEDDNELGTHGGVSVLCDGDGDESESKKRKADISPSGVSRAIKDPRVVVQTTSEVDILDDGYKWRKYGQKVVKGNPNPRSYYKCTSAGCSVRKHVERASHDLNSVITTYEGKHSHDIPAARNSEVPNNASNNGSTQHRPEHSKQPHMSNMSQYQRPGSFGSFGLPITGPHLIPPNDHHGYGMNQHSMANMAAHGGWGYNHGQQYIGQSGHMNVMELMVMPKGEPKVEPMSESGLSLPNASAVYQQVMSRMPLGPHM